MLFSLTRPSVGWLEQVVARESTAALTYDAVGATARGETPSGYRPDSWEVDVGSDEGSRFERCGAAVLGWAAQRGAGIEVQPDAPVADGQTFALVLPLPVGYAIATARIVLVIETADTIGFAYGTLPAHPEEGEEIFLVHRRDGRVVFEVSAFSRPRDPLARLGFPVTRWLQKRTNETYLAAICTVACQSREARAHRPRRTDRFGEEHRRGCARSPARGARSRGGRRRSGRRDVHAARDA